MSFIFLVASTLVIFPARREFEDAKLEVEALGSQLDGTRVIAEAELALRRYLVLAQSTGSFVMAMFLVAGLLALILPQPESSSGVLRATVIPFALLAAEIGDGMLQGFLLMATLEQRRARTKWRQISGGMAGEQDAGK